MNLIVSGVNNAIQVRREGVLSHLPCHSAIIRVTHPDQPEIAIHAVFSPAPHPCWLIGATGEVQKQTEFKYSPDYSVQIENDASVVIVTEDGDKTELF